jgi:biotin-(acetyl-CoA carboxylase) ligase
MLVTLFLVVVAFAVGVGIGINTRNTPTIDAAINVLKEAEVDAQAVVNKITNHKNS